MLEYQYFVFNLSITGSTDANGIHIFINPSTDPILMLSVTIAVISLGDINCANCEFVSIRSSRGSIVTTLSQGSTIRLVHISRIFSKIISSISVNSLLFARGAPPPPSIRSTIVNPIFVARSIIILPSNGAKLTTPRSTGLESALANSE